MASRNSFSGDQAIQLSTNPYQVRPPEPISSTPIEFQISARTEAVRIGYLAFPMHALNKAWHAHENTFNVVSEMPDPQTKSWAVKCFANSFDREEGSSSFAIREFGKIVRLYSLSIDVDHRLRKLPKADIENALPIRRRYTSSVQTESPACAQTPDQVAVLWPSQQQRNRPHRLQPSGTSHVPR